VVLERRLRIRGILYYLELLKYRPFEMGVRVID
jgi:hypothetical protein